MSRRDWRRVIRWARLGDWALEGLSVGLVVAAAIGFSGYAGRRALVGELAEGYLRERGVESEIEVLAVDSRGFVGRVRLGPANDPDFAAERVEVWLAAPPPPEGPYALRPDAIRVVAPRLKARWTGERLTLGALDPLIEDALSRPKQDDRPGPLVVVENGALSLLTPYGPLRASGSGRVDDGRVERVDLALPPATLQGRTFRARLGGGTARVRVSGDVADLRLELAGSGRRTGWGELDGARLTLSGQAPYPDVEARRLDGPIELALSMAAAQARRADGAVDDLQLDATARGRLAGGSAETLFTGGLDVGARAGRLGAEALSARGLRAGVRFSNASVRLDASGVEGRGAARATLAAAEGGAGRATVAGLTAALQSPALTFAIGSDAVRANGPLRLAGTASRASAGELAGRGLRLNATSAAAAFSDGRLSGPVRLLIDADAATAPQGSAQALRGEVATTLAVLGAPAPVSGAARAGRLQLAAAKSLALSGARLRFEGRAGPDVLALDADFETRAALPAARAGEIAAGLPVVGDSPAYAGAVARALGDLRIAAPGVRLANGALALTAPVRLRGPGGQQGELAPVGRLALSPTGAQGRFRIAARGGGLPAITADVERLVVDGADFSGQGRVRAALDIPLAQGAVVEARGRAETRGGAFTFTASDCLRLRAAHVELGENDVDDLSTRLCPLDGAPVVQTGAAGYRIRGRFAEAALAAPFLNARATAGSGVLDVRGGEAGLTAAEVRIASAEVVDTFPAAEGLRRFHPLGLSGTASLGEGRWRAQLDILDAPAGLRLAQAALTHAVQSGEGGVDITADDLRFAPEGLQPHDLTPLAAGVTSEVDGAVDFTGRIAWTPGALPTSGGRLTTAGVSLDTPLGRVTGLGRELTLSSLAPLTAPPGQVLTAERIEAFTPITDIEAELGFDAEAVQLQGAAVSVAGGRLQVEPMRIPFAEPRTLSGAVRLDDVDLGRLIETTGFADKVDLVAVVDGRIPFQAGPDGLRFAGGELRSVRPGRLSIDREALTEVASGASASGDPVAAPGAPAAQDPAAPVNAFQDFAYQALENLAYSDLEVSVDSRPQGRLGMVFTIRGRHDPPEEKRARIGIFDLLRGRAFDRAIPLPSNTPVNLTLDTSLNFDELLATWLELQRSRSAPVQSAPTTTTP